MTVFNTYPPDLKDLGRVVTSSKNQGGDLFSSGSRDIRGPFQLGGAAGGERVSQLRPVTRHTKGYTKKVCRYSSSFLLTVSRLTKTFPGVLRGKGRGVWRPVVR